MAFLFHRVTSLYPHHHRSPKRERDLRDTRGKTSPPVSHVRVRESISRTDLAERERESEREGERERRERGWSLAETYDAWSMFLPLPQDLLHESNERTRAETRVVCASPRREKKRRVVPPSLVRAPD